MEKLEFTKKYYNYKKFQNLIEYAKNKFLLNKQKYLLI